MSSICVGVIVENEYIYEINQEYFYSRIFKHK